MPLRAHNQAAADPVEELRSAPAEQDADGEGLWEPVAPSVSKEVRSV